jgi:hypothetical protein
MPTFTITITETTYADYEVVTDSPEEAKALALDAHLNRETFENLVSVKEGRVILMDKGTLNDVKAEAGLEG